MAYETALTIISDAAAELGLGAVSDAFGSTDANVVQLRSLLKSVGTKVRKARAWKQLQQQYTLYTSTNVGRYTLPADYGRFIPGTAWNRTNRVPVPNVTPQEFEGLKARVGAVVYNVLFRVLQGNFQLYPDNSTQGSWVLAFEYVSSFWARPAATSAASAGQWNDGVAYSASATVDFGGRRYSTVSGGTSGTHGPVHTSGSASDGGVTWAYVGASGAGTVAANGDVVNLDSHLMSRALKLAWLEAKGLDTSAAAADYNQTLAAASDEDSQGPTLQVTGGRMASPLSWRNVPDSGYGQ